MLDGIDEPRLFLIVFLMLCAVLEIAFRLGRRDHADHNEQERAHLNALQAALLGLLALLLGFNFAMAASRFDARKTLIQDEVAAIRTSYLRAQLLPIEERQDVTDLLRAYVNARIDFIQAGENRVAIERADARAQAIEGQLWMLTTMLAVRRSDALPTGLFIPSLNDMINVNERRRAAIENHVPETVLYLLMFVAMSSFGFIAYGYGLTDRRRHGSTALFALIIAIVLTIILDLDRPRSGLIRVGEESLVRLRDSLGPVSP
jgi:hypothetical protein